jgi:hypothetical protein
MMVVELADDIQNLEARIRTAEIEKKELLAANAAPEEIADRNFYISAIAAAKKVLVLQQEQQTEEKHRAKIYSEWYPRACDAKERAETARQRHERSVPLYTTAEKNVDLIDLAISEHRKNEPRRDNFPSEKTLRQWNLRLRHLGEEREKRERSRIAAKTEMEDAVADLRKLVEEYQHAANLCRLYAPRNAEAIKAAQPVPVQWALPSSPPSRISSL